MAAPKQARPLLPHVNTAPAFDNTHGSGELSDESSSDDEPDLLTQINHRQSEGYRYIYFDLPSNHVSNTKKKYEKRVSFDTIDIQYSDDWGVDSDDEVSRVELYELGRGRARSPNGRSPLLSPSTSPTRRGFSPLRGGNIDMARFFQARPEYPTRPIITHRGCTFTKVHRQFEDLYLGKLNNEENGFKVPVLPRRTVLVYISGRKHTWVALDWILHNFIEHGDTVVVVSAINHSFEPRRRYLANYTSPQRITAKAPRARLRQRNRPEFIKVIAKSVMSYIMEVINKDVIAKVTVELAEGSTKEVLRDMYQLYQPNLVLTGTKPNTRISAPLKLWLSSKLTDRLVKNFPLPVIVVPAMNLESFEIGLQKHLSARHFGRQNSTALSLVHSQATHHDLDSSSIFSELSQSSAGSSTSYSSFDEITHLYRSYRSDVETLLAKLHKAPMNEDHFVNILKSLSDKSANFCQEIRDIDPDFKGKGAKLARAITGSTSFGRVPYKTKSLLAPLEKVQTTNTSQSSVPSVSYKEMKRNLQRNAMLAKQRSPPLISIEEPSPIDGPRKTSLKFDLSTPPSRTTSLEASPVPESKPRRKGKQLKKSLSHEIDNSSSRPTLEPLKSHPDITSLVKDGKKSKKSKKKFWKFF